MAEFLNTEKAYAAIVDVVNKADKKLVLISPYISIPERLMERLKDVCRRDSISITLVCRKGDLKPETASALKQIPKLQLRFLDNLHAKCFYNDSAMVITSLNLYEYSQQNNREMGVYLTQQDDGSVFEEALDEAEFIVRMAVPEDSRRTKTSPVSTNGKDKDRTKNDVLPGIVSSIQKILSSSKTGQQGHCIRCGKDVSLNPDSPYCASCYGVWKRYKDPEYEEEYCHWCGKPNELTTMKRPLCYSCYRKLRRNK